MSNPNFPVNLDIRPLLCPDPMNHSASDSDGNFSASAQEAAIREYGIAGRVWEAAYAMRTYLAPSVDVAFDPPSPSLSDRHPLRVLELGSGNGIVAAALAGQLKSPENIMIITDLPEVQHPVVLVRPLTWGDHTHALAINDELCSLLSLSASSLSHIICSDLVYFPELLAPLLRSLIHLTSPPFVSNASIPLHEQHLSKVIVSYKIRSLAKETSFWSAFGLWFSFEPVLERRNHPVPETSKAQDVACTDSWRRFGASFGSDMFIFVAQRRAESLTWEMPKADEDLLGGVGAHGNTTRKGDGFFESLLLMNMDVVE